MNLIAELATLAVQPPAELLDRVVARWVRVPGPVGEVHVASTDHGVCYLRLDSDGGFDGFAAGFRERFGRPLLPATGPPTGLLPALRVGRAGGLRIDLRALSEFERAVLGAAATIPRGQLRPYAWLAARIGRPGAVRAVGNALGRNPVPLLIPCHRVIRTDGAVGDYVFGTATKRAVLEAEGVDLAEVGALAGRGVRYLGSDTTGVVCFPTCSNARRITPAHRREFRSVPEAISAGYRPCRRCRPVTDGSDRAVVSP
jgi:O-6-methylguanine DNA methyltransferase